MTQAKSLYFIFVFMTTLSISAQFHTLKIPKPSNEVMETQTLGVTDITLSYGSPSINGRDVWNDPNVIPQNGDPIAWRAGANMNTTITFSTDVSIEGQPLKAGTYGFHIIPKGETYSLLFAHNNNQWGSYYLNIEKDVTLTVDVAAESCPFSEKLDYEFLDWKGNEVKIGVEWADKRIPFTVSVDLNKTVVESLRSELRGINTYHWEAWNDAANWCLAHDTNLEEALAWADRSINGGFHGFAANRNFTNVGTKSALLKRLGHTQEYTTAVNELKNMDYSENQAFQFGRNLLSQKEYQLALEFATEANKKYSNSWILIINEGLAQYFVGDTKKAVKNIKSAITLAPQQFHDRFNTVIEEMQAGTYQIPF